MWRIEWKFSKDVFQPGDKGKVLIWLENVYSVPTFVSEVGIQFDWQGDYWFPLPLNVSLDCGKKASIAIDFEIPSNIVGAHYLRFGVKSNGWSTLEWTEWLEITIGVFPKLKAFVSRLGSPQEKERLRSLLGTIEAWGFEIYTYDGTDIPEAPYIIAQAVKDWADCHVVIATHQFYDYVHNMGQTSPWIHREFFGSFTLGKPTIIFRQRGVYFDGLLSSTVPTIEFSNIEEAISNAHILLPRLRESVLEQRRAKSSSWVWPLVGGILIVSFVGALAVGLSKSK